MAHVDCPNCGERPIEEFRYGGELPHVPDSVVGAEARNVDYLWFSNNNAGNVTERWFHLSGCRRWHTYQRDTNAAGFHGFADLG